MSYDHALLAPSDAGGLHGAVTTKILHPRLVYFLTLHPGAQRAAIPKRREVPIALTVSVKNLNKETGRQDLDISSRPPR